MYAHHSSLMALGDLQKRVLTEIFNGAVFEEGHTVSSLAKKLKTDHAVIFRCVQSLEERYLIKSEQKAKKAKRYLKLTSLGFVIAVEECGLDMEEITEKHGTKKELEHLSLFKKLLPDKTERRKGYLTVFKFWRNNNLFVNGESIVTDNPYWEKLTMLALMRGVTKVRTKNPAAVDEKEYQRLKKELDIPLSQLLGL